MPHMLLLLIKSYLYKKLSCLIIKYEILFSQKNTNSTNVIINRETVQIGRIYKYHQFIII
jgi:hypothetical protein